MVRVGVGVVEQMNGVARVGLPCEELDETFSLNVNNALVMGDPADSVVQQPEQVAVAGEPVGALDVSGELGHAAGADFAQDDGRLFGVRDERVSKFWRIVHEAGDDGEHRMLHGL